MKKNYDGLDAYVIDLNDVVLTTSPGNCNAATQIMETGSNTCEECDWAGQTEGYTEHV